MDPAHWDTERWNRIQLAVQETRQVSVAIKILSHCSLDDPYARTVPANNVDPANLSVTEDDLPVLEVSVDFPLTTTQVNEASLSGAVSGAANAGRLLFQAVDLLVFQGTTVPGGAPDPNDPIATNVKVRGTPPKGLVDAAASSIPVKQASSGSSNVTFGNNTFVAVVEAISTLQLKGHAGPYALVLPVKIFADAFALDGQFVPADRISPLVPAGFYPALLPEAAGLVISTGGKVVELCVGVDIKTEFVQQVSGGEYVFQDLYRFTLRVVDNTGLVRLDFSLSGAAPR
jgi:hypothetical protein